MKYRVPAALALAACLTGCKGHGGKTVPATTTCDLAAAAYVDRHTTEIKPGDQRPAFVAAVAAVCTQHQWAPAVRDCLKAAADGPAAEACLPDRAELVAVLDAIQQRRGELAGGSPPVLGPR
ncbi:MAG TPA: hypothetical protein VHE35_11010 [Kofleriaceae bacterium]|nr:hypothetical protein [Kofleriaceae bacterium]